MASLQHFTFYLLSILKNGNVFAGTISFKNLNIIYVEMHLYCAKIRRSDIVKEYKKSKIGIYFMFTIASIFQDNIHLKWVLFEQRFLWRIKIVGFTQPGKTAYEISFAHNKSYHHNLFQEKYGKQMVTGRQIIWSLYTSFHGLRNINISINAPQY